MITLKSSETALILVDLQAGILRLPLAPISAADIVSRSAQLARAFRRTGGVVTLVNVAWSADFGDAPSQNSDSAHQYDIKEDWADLAPELELAASDIKVTKRQWGAFYGTELDLQLRRRRISTVVIAGVATNMGVESTVRSAWEHGYDVVVISDACSTFSPDMQDFAMGTIFPMIARVLPTEAVIEALTAID
jgi:nicotinamidase-related amidase